VYLIGEGRLEGGSARGQFVIDPIELFGIPSSQGAAPGYDLSLDLSFIGTCGDQADPVDATTWGRIKAAYR
jgi:hypothetical protein